MEPAWGETDKIAVLLCANFVNAEQLHLRRASMALPLDPKKNSAEFHTYMHTVNCSPQLPPLR